MKTLIVREAFTLGAEFYERGAHITDPTIIEQAKKSHPQHVLNSQEEAAEAKPAPKSKSPAAE